MLDKQRPPFTELTFCTVCFAAMERNNDGAKEFKRAENCSARDPACISNAP